MKVSKSQFVKLTILENFSKKISIAQSTRNHLIYSNITISKNWFSLTILDFKIFKSHVTWT